MKRPLVALLFSLCLPVPGQALDGWYDPAFLESHDEQGGSGYIRTPAADVLPIGVIAAGIHRFNAKLAYGFYNLLEVGMTVELDAWKIDEAEKNNLFNARLAILQRERHHVSLAIGADGVGPEDLGLRNLGYVAKTQLASEENLYGVASVLLPWLPMAMLSLGWGSGALPPHAFGCLSVSPLDGLLLMGEYDGVGTNLGGRLFLSSQIKLDVAFLHTQTVNPDQPFARVLQDNIRFGVSYTETWP